MNSAFSSPPARPERLTGVAARGRSAQAGFTLVEAIVAIVISGIIGVMVATFIKLPVKNYVDSLARADMSDTADSALRRIRRDLHLALPNSIRVTGSSIEFLITKTGGRYLAAEDGDATRPVLDFVNPLNKTFTVIGPVPTGKQAIVSTASDEIVVYNLGSDPDFNPANAYSGQNRASVAGVSTVGGNLRVALAANPFATQSVPMPSPTARFQVVTGAVTYFCNGTTAHGDGTLWRISGYPIAQNQFNPPPTGIYPFPVTAGVTTALVAKNVDSCVFTYDVLVNAPKALVGITLKLTDPTGAAGSLSLTHQVHLDNTP